MSRFLLAALFLFAGLNHFRNPQPYLAIMPPMLPFPRELVALSGVFEMAGGAGILLPRTRKIAAWGLVALLVAVFPANIYSAFHGMTLNGNEVPRWILWARLPLQLPLLWWALRSAEMPEEKRKEGDELNSPPLPRP